MSFFFTIAIVSLKISAIETGTIILEPEKLLDLVVEPCFETEHLKVLYPENSFGSLFSIGSDENGSIKRYPVCLTALTDKNEADWTELQDTGLFVSISTRIKFRLTELVNCQDKICIGSLHCDMMFHGHQMIFSRQQSTSCSGKKHKGVQKRPEQVYRLSPDFGYYKSCNSMLSKYWHQVRQHINKDKNNPDKIFRFNYEKTCPLSELPLKYEYQVSCIIKPTSWYMVDYHSRIDFDYQNHSTKSVTDRQAILVRTLNPVFHLTQRSFPYHMGRMMSIFLEKFSTQNNCGLRVHIHFLRLENLPFDIELNLKLKYSYTPTKNGSFSDKNVQTDEIRSIINITMNDRVELLHEAPAQNYSVQILSLEACHRTYGVVRMRNRNVTAILSEENFSTCKLFDFSNCTLRAMYAKSFALKIWYNFLPINGDGPEVDLMKQNEGGHGSPHGHHSSHCNGMDSHG
uniref:Uncharacterized protein n=1 Tax=Romanomermis culicivorax TaxID=13658 RepID=A0A915KZQ2_ROMCU